VRRHPVGHPPDKPPVVFVRHMLESCENRDHPAIRVRPYREPTLACRCLSSGSRRRGGRQSCRRMLRRELWTCMPPL
jgi:hypothetical protein